MAITRVWIEKGCVSCGMSEVRCPEVFKLGKDKGATVMEGINYSIWEEKIKDAASSCPVQVIMYDSD
jgi:ferredoxin